jgi:ABC-type microcin C transport system duplicated ATPase subunit YejF
VLLRGRDTLQLTEQELRSVRGKEVAMVFQDPMSSLNPVVRIRDQIVPPMRQHLGLSHKAAL